MFASRFPLLRPLTLSIHLACIGLALAGAAAAQMPAAVAASQRFDIPAGPLGVALRQFADKANILLSSDARLTQDKNSPGLHAVATPAQGLQQLLSGSGLAAVAQADGSFVLRAADATPAPGIKSPAAATEPAVMAEVVVLGERSTQADGSYRPVPSKSALHSDMSTLDAPQVLNVVAAQVISDQRPRNLDDALANVSGITQGNTLAGTQDTIMKRGFGGNRDGSIMHNGMPLVQGRGMNAAAESVEVLKGPASLLYGIMDPGGVVNVVSKKPLLEQSTSLSVLASTYGDGKNGGGVTLDSTGAIGTAGLAYRVIVDHVNEDYWRNFGRHRETLFAPSLAWYAKDTQVVLSYEHRQFLYPFDRGTALDPRTNAPLDIPITRRLDEPFNVMDGRSDLGQLTVDQQLNKEWKAHLGVSYNREVYDANQLRVNGVNLNTGTLVRSNDATHGAISTDSYGLFYLQGSLNLAGLHHEMQIGSDIEYRRIFRADLLRQATTSTFSYLNPVYGTEAPSATVSASDSDQSDQLHDKSVFAQDSIYLTDRWIVSAGARYQDYQQIAGRGRPFTANTNTDSSKWLPKAGVVYKLSPTWSLYGSYTESLKPASTIAPLSTGVVIDSAVLPEQAKAWEAGVKLANPAGFSGSVALFNIDKKNVLVSQFNDITKLTDWRTAGAARARGLEADISGRLSRSWNLIGSYAYTDAITTKDPLYQGFRLWNVARQTASLSAAYDAGAVFGDDKLRTGIGAHYVGKRAGDSANSFMLPAYTVADGFATYDTRIGGRSVRFQLNVKNLFDRHYYPSSVNKYFVSVGDARQISLLTTLDF
ncbi:TonB-dependent siderophore receptor [Duganella levis]|uniref:TonB-dependent siderophore receptor n=1 Tax=Duganella levis TaxID=2692169 RepID=A0ABW9VTE7_9BURK|nr:TonB-dependent siderophore receptor [Duganella levis]